MLRKKDLLWAFAYPIYQLLGTLRHELSHAAARVLRGGEVTELVWWPTRTDGGGMRWGYVAGSGPNDWLTAGSPYLCDLVTYALCFWVCWTWTSRRRWIWVNCVFLGLLSPLVNSAYNYRAGLRWLWRDPTEFPRNDVAKLLAHSWGDAVHVYFVSTFLLYAVGLYFVLRRSPSDPPTG